MNSTIEMQRKKMIEAAKRYGYSAKVTVKYSQELDKMLNVYSADNNMFRQDKMTS